MKQVTPELKDFLHYKTEFFMCDLYEITLKSGLTFRYANFDMDITLLDGRVFSCKGPQFKRDRTKISAGIAVDQLKVTVYIDDKDEINNNAIMHIAHNGGFDEATLTLYRCFMDLPNSAGDENSTLMTLTEVGGLAVSLPNYIIVGVVEMFTGYIDVDGGGGLEMNWSVKSGVQKLNVEYPLRKYYPNCPYSLYDTSCGLDLNTYTTTGTVTAVTSHQEFTTNLTRPDNYYDQGGIEWLSGPLSGVSAPIKTYKNKKITMLIPLDAKPNVGDTFKVYPGCDKTPNTCKNKFNNFNRNRATPYIPLKETIK